jgi:hypothetical protein
MPNAIITTPVTAHRPRPVMNEPPISPTPWPRKMPVALSCPSPRAQRGADYTDGVEHTYVRYAGVALRLTFRGWEEWRPTSCPTCGADLGPHRVLVGVAQCACGSMHRTHYCSLRRHDVHAAVRVGVPPPRVRRAVKRRKATYSVGGGPVISGVATGTVGSEGATHSIAGAGAVASAGGAVSAPLVISHCLDVSPVVISVGCTRPWRVPDAESTRF